MSAPIAAVDEFPLEECEREHPYSCSTDSSRARVVSDLVSYGVYDGPCEILEMYQEEVPLYGFCDRDSYRYKAWFEDFMAGPLDAVLTGRNEPYLLHHDHEQHIIDNVMEEHDRFKRLESWGSSNWGYLRGRPSVHSTMDLLKDLKDNLTEAYDTWNEEDRLCEHCLEKFMSDHLHLWYLEEQVKQVKRKLLPFIICDVCSPHASQEDI
ncbi:hypothetical protein EDB19DRAFT_1904913 [Suillus lakei]|nr:hypothetical protein EDB19DRAFT_1904913 [Suillus lakei]